MYTETEKQTKAIYVEQHKAYIRDRSIFDRFYAMARQESTFGLPEGYLKGKRVADIGCGNSAYFEKALFDNGCEHIACLDIGEEWIPELTAALDAVEVPREAYSTVAGSATNLPFDDDSFDVTFSNGVIMHLADKDEAARAMREMARVTKSGGLLYVYVAISTGIVDKYILPAMRAAYRDMPELRQFIDTLDVATLHEATDGIVQTAQEHDPEIAPALASAFGMLTLDTITFWQNVLQVPVQLGNELSEAWGREQFEQLGFVDIRRVPSVYWKRNDARKFLAPLHYNTANPVANLLYGDGHIKMIARKA
jgi:ubiquinone/menaquinone biosynthesis C-methylase UbiE